MRITTLFIISMLTIFSASAQVPFTIGVFTDATSIHPDVEGYDPAGNLFRDKSLGVQVSYAHLYDEDCIVEPVIGYTITADESLVHNERGIDIDSDLFRPEEGSTNSYSVTYKGKDAAFSTKQLNVGLNLLKRVSTNLEVGAGLYGLFKFTTISDIDITATHVYSNGEYFTSFAYAEINERDITRIAPSVPIIVRGVMPLGKRALKLQLEGHLTYNPFIRTSVMFTF